MSWTSINQEVEDIRKEFSRTFKCVNKEKLSSRNTCNKHIKTLVVQHNLLTEICRKYFEKPTEEHKASISKVFVKLKGRLSDILNRFYIAEGPSESLIEYFNLEIELSEGLTEFLSSAAKLLPEFDGKAENLHSFLDALQLLDLFKADHEQVAVTLIKTKLKGTARNLICNEITIVEVIAKLKTSVKGESIDALSAKLLNIKHNKNINEVAKEITKENLLQSAYISDGLPIEVAAKYATQTEVKSIVKNATNEKTKLIIQAGQFETLGDVVTKFVSTSGMLRVLQVSVIQMDPLGAGNTVIIINTVNRIVYKTVNSKTIISEEDIIKVITILRDDNIQVAHG